MVLMLPSKWETVSVGETRCVNGQGENGPRIRTPETENCTKKEKLDPKAAKGAVKTAH